MKKITITLSDDDILNLLNHNYDLYKDLLITGMLDDFLKEILYFIIDTYGGDIPQQLLNDLEDKYFEE